MIALIILHAHAVRYTLITRTSIQCDKILHCTARKGEHTIGLMVS